ncbi:MAG: PH domain-containing protein [Lentilactobacillus diolivorans]|nr:PH domain-containing protein [Lentilactobacillus diolivorans]RRG03535.1 MAG: hypothetical protein DUD34_04470 [Lactobacillus sp.]
MTESNQLPPQIKTVWRLSALFTFLILAIVGIGCYFLATTNNWQWLSYPSLVLIGIAIIYFIIELILVPYRYAFWRYTLTDDAVELRSGYIFRHLVSIPIARVQDVTLEAGPVLQSQKLQKVRVTTASTSHTIDGLEPEVGEHLRKQIMQMAVEVNDHDV